MMPVFREISSSFNPSICPNNQPAQHAYSETEQAHHLRKPLQRCVNLPNSRSRLTSCAEGVLVAKKDFNAPKHEELDVPNLHVIKALQSLSSKGYVKTQFSWQYYYYVLTPEGVDFLREWYVGPHLPVLSHCAIRLHLPTEIVPATHKKTPRPPRPAQVRTGGEGTYRAPRGDRDDYRKKEDAPANYNPHFAGVGRGGPRA